jgi:DNA-directed RNA polymerase subunit RPC12/RpoP
MGSWDKSIECPRCSGGMEPGFIVDESYGQKFVSKWVAGAPQKTWWMGRGLRLGRSEQIEVATYRCRRCGYLESYA